MEEREKSVEQDLWGELGTVMGGTVIPIVEAIVLKSNYKKGVYSHLPAPDG